LHQSIDSQTNPQTTLQHLSQLVLQLHTQETNMDVEEPFQARRRGPNGAVNHSALPHNHPVNILYRIGVIGGSLYALHELKVFHKVVMSPDVDHEWFKIGLAATIGRFVPLFILDANVMWWSLVHSLICECCVSTSLEYLAQYKLFLLPYHLTIARLFP